MAVEIDDAHVTPLPSLQLAEEAETEGIKVAEFMSCELTAVYHSLYTLRLSQRLF